MSKKYNRINNGDIFGNWEVIDINDFEQKKGYKKILCKCKCINQTVKYVDERNLKNGTTTSCGKCSNKIIKVGDLFGLWTALENETMSEQIKCRCACGVIKNVNKFNLCSGKSLNCGCEQKNNHFAINQYKKNDNNKKISIGHKYGKWTILKQVKTASYLCECECIYHTRQTLQESRLLSKDIGGCKHCRPMVGRKKGMPYDRVGETFGYLTILGINQEKTNKKGRIFVDAMCKCGNIKVVDKNSITRGRVVSCGCKKHEYNNEELLIGKHFKHLTVIGFLGREHKNKNQSVLKFKCKCDCGKEIIVSKGNLLYGSTWSCGCMKRSHGEKTIYDFLYKNQFEFEEQYRIDDCRNQLPLPFDFAIFKNSKLSCLIEFDGRQHFEPYQFNNSSKSKAIENFKQCVARDDIKTSYCKENKIPLLRVTYEDLESGDLLYKVWDFLESRKLIEKVS